MDQAKVYGFQMVHTDEMMEILKKEHVLLVDLRDENSYRKGHIRHAKNLPFEQISQWEKEIPERVNLALYCRYGNLSLLAARRLRGRKGAVYTLIGGYEAYQSALLSTT